MFDLSKYFAKTQLIISYTIRVRLNVIILTYLYIFLI